MTLPPWRGDCVTQSFKALSAGAPLTFVLPVSGYGVGFEYILAMWPGTTSLPQTDVPLLNLGSLSPFRCSPAAYPELLGGDQFSQMSTGEIQISGWQTVDAGGVLNTNPNPNPTPTSAPPP